MRAWKRILALTLSIAMIFGCLSVGSYATNEAFDFVVTKVEKYSEETYAILEGEIASAKPGEVIVATVSIVNNTDEDVEVGSYGVGLKYDEKVLTPYTDSAAPKKTPFCKGISYDVSGSNFIAGVKEQGLVKPTGATADGVTVEGRSSTELGKIAFKVAANAEKANTLFQIDDTLDDNELSNCDKVALTFKAGEPFSLFINGVAPTLGKVTVTDKDNNTVLDTLNSELKFDTLEVNGTTNYTYQAHAWSTSGKEITGNVTWKFKVGNELCTEFRGATIDETTGQIFIPKDASTDVSGTTFAMSVVAQAKEGVTAEKDIETSLIQVRREEYRIAEIQISRKEGETGALIIPGTGEEAATAEFVATCTNQYGKPYTGNQTIYWNYGRKDTNRGVSGVTIKGAVLSVSSDAKSVENGSVVLVVTATAGSGEKKVTSNGVEITVQRDNVQRPASIVITGGPEGSTLAVPKTGTANATYTATVYDQYGTEITNPGTIEWKLYDEYGKEHPLNGVNIANGVVTVTKEAAKNSFNDDGMRNIRVRAYCGEVYGESGAVHLTREKARATRIAMEDITIAVPKSDEANVTRSYLEVYDQYDIKMGSPTFEKTTTPNTLNGVTFTDDKITVTSAAAGNTFTDGKLEISVTITCNSASTDIVSETKTITLTRDSAEAKTMIWGTTGTFVEVPANDSGKADANVTVTVYDQYGQPMTNAEVELDGAQEGFVWEGGKLYVTKAAAKRYFADKRPDEVTVYVKLKSGDATATAKVTLKLENAQTGPQSAEITGSANIAKPTGEPNTAVYSILNNEMKDQYGLPITFDPSNLTMKLYSDAACGNEVTNGPVTLSGKTITVTSGAEVDTKYYLKAYYNDQPCSDAKTITITNKQEGAPLTVVQGDITYGTAVSPSVSNTPAGAGTITYTYVGRDGTTYNSSDAPTNAGKYTVTATCEDATHIYTGSVQFEIKPKALTADMLTIKSSGFVYNGLKQSPVYEVKDGTTVLNAEYYDVTGEMGKDAGTYTLRITGKGNYTGTAEQSWSIEKATLTVTGAAIPAINYDPSFDGALNVNSVTFSGLENNEMLTKDTDYTVSGFTNAKNAGTHQGEAAITATLNENGTAKNYKFDDSTALLDGRRVVVSGDVTINKINHQNETAAAAGKYGNQLSVDLSQVLPEGWSATASSIDNTNAVLTEIHGGAMYIMEQDGKLWLQLTNDSNKVGKDATVTLTVNSTNYNPFTITVTVTAQKKETQTVTANDLNVTYGDAGVKLNASALDNAKLTYQVTEGADVVAVDANGNVTLRKSGIAKIQITAVETEDYGTANTTVTVTVAKRSLTVKANDLTAYVGGQLPALDYTVTGLVSGDTLTTVPELELKDVPAGVDPMKTAGTYTIGFKTAPVADKDKYDLTVETGTLTVSSRPNVNPVPAGNSVKLEEAAGGKLTSSVSRATKGTTVTITVKPDAGYQLEELEVLDKNGESLPLKELANGKFSFQMPDSKVTVQASFVQESTYAGYPDVLPQDWFYSSVRYVTERGLMNGTPNGFEPNMDSSRATIWTILARFSGVDTTVVSGEWYAVARQWAMENGVSDGTNPNGVITREQLATMLYRFAKNKGLVQEPVTADLSVFVDAGQISDYALDAMRWAVSVGLLNGMDGSRLAPHGSAARAQVAAMLMRFDQLAK